MSKTIIYDRRVYCKDVSIKEIIDFLTQKNDYDEWKDDDWYYHNELLLAIQAFIENQELDNTIGKSLKKEKILNLYEEFKKWFKEQNIESPKVSVSFMNNGIHGNIDLISYKQKKFWLFKILYMDEEQDITKDILKMKIYQYAISDIHKTTFDWEIVYFDQYNDKRIFICNKQTIGEIDIELLGLIKKTKELLELTQFHQWEPFNNKKNIKQWKPKKEINND